MILMIVLKRSELKSGQPSPVSRLGRRADLTISSTYNSLRQVVNFFNRHTFIALAQWLAFHVLLRVRNVYVEIKHQALQNPHGKKLIDAVRGRGTVTGHGASFYLRRIGEK
jgi:hypothetical protein